MCCSSVTDLQLHMVHREYDTAQKVVHFCIVGGTYMDVFTTIT